MWEEHTSFSQIVFKSFRCKPALSLAWMISLLPSYLTMTNDAVALMLMGTVFASNRKAPLGEWARRALPAAHAVERRHEGCPPGSCWEGGADRPARSHGTHGYVCSSTTSTGGIGCQGVPSFWWFWTETQELVLGDRISSPCSLLLV